MSSALIDLFLLFLDLRRSRRNAACHFVVSLYELQPLPLAKVLQPRRSRVRGKTAIITDSPYRNKLLQKKALNVSAGMKFLLTILHACSVKAFIPYLQRAGYSVNLASIGLMFHVLE